MFDWFEVGHGWPGKEGFTEGVEGLIEGLASNEYEGETVILVLAVAVNITVTASEQ